MDFIVSAGDAERLDRSARIAVGPPRIALVGNVGPLRDPGGLFLLWRGNLPALPFTVAALDFRLQSFWKILCGDALRVLRQPRLDLVGRQARPRQRPHNPSERVAA